MIEELYAIGLAWMARPLLPGFVTLGAVLVRVVRELDPDDARQDRAWLAASSILERERERERP